MARDEFSVGDEVEWNTPQGTTRGTIKRKLTEPTKIKEHEVKASKDEPQYLVERESGAEAAHKPGALRNAKQAAGRT